MTEPIPADRSVRPAAARRYGPTVGEPPPVVDPRRWGSLIGLVGGLVFIVSYSSALGAVVSTAAWTAGAILVVAALVALYVRPVALGPMVRPSRLALVAYVTCVVAELALINIGSRALAAAGDGELRPALIATVVGLHFIPFAWAFHERMFFWLGGLTCGLGAAGLLAGVAGLARAAETAAVSAGLVMLIVITLYAAGRFARQPSPQGDPTPKRSSSSRGVAHTGRGAVGLGAGTTAHTEQSASPPGP